LSNNIGIKFYKNGLKKVTGKDKNLDKIISSNSESFKKHIKKEESLKRYYENFKNNNFKYSNNKPSKNKPWLMKRFYDLISEFL